MEKIIEIDLFRKEDFFEKYNRKIVSKELINYMIDSISSVSKDDSIKIIVNNKIKEDIDIINLIKEALKNEYNQNMCLYHKTNTIQFIYLLIGIFWLFISTLVKATVLKEVILIGGWVFIWALLETEIFADLKSRKRRKIIKKILNGTFEEVKKK